MRETKPKTYRVVQETIAGVPMIAERWGVPDGEVIDRLVAGELAKGSEKKSGGARKVLPVVTGTFPGSKLPAPVKKKEVHEMNAQGQIERKPFLKPNGKI